MLPPSEALIAEGAAKPLPMVTAVGSALPLETRLQLNRAMLSSFLISVVLRLFHALLLLEHERLLPPLLQPGRYSKTVPATRTPSPTAGLGDEAPVNTKIASEVAASASPSASWM